MNQRIALLFTALLLCFFAGSAQNKTFTTNLPIFYLDTDGREIPDEPKISAKMEIAWKGNGEDNSTSDSRDHFSGNIAIELRGSTSQSFPKKSYGFELKDEDGEDVDFPLLDMPEEEDWILYAPYSDKTLMRNVLIFTLASKFSKIYAPRCRYVELFLNNEYQGIYVLMEKIKRDKKRVDINKLKEDEISGKDLTGGYIIKIDKTTGSDGGGAPIGWNSKYVNANGNPTFYQYHYPKAEDIQAEQRTYIQNYVDSFETAISNLAHDEESGYQNFINPESFYDYIILNELSKNIDAYRLSSFLYKDKAGKLNAGPIWDYNLSFGNADYNDGWNTNNMILSENDVIPFWWKKLFSDTSFVNPFKCRWEEVTPLVINEGGIFEIIDSLNSVLGDAVDRNFQRWPVLGKDVWPNYYVGSTHRDEVDWMKNWISKRLDYLHSNLPGECLIQGNSDFGQTKELLVKCYPNPFNEKLNFEISSKSTRKCSITIYNVNGMSVKSMTFFALNRGENTFELNLNQLGSGIYFYQVIQGPDVDTGKFIKQ